jgi:hypothetical protein
MDLLSNLLLVVLALAWLVAVASAIELVVKHRPDGRAVSDYVSGQAWFGADAFAASGAATRRRMHAALAVFFLIAFTVAAVVIGSELL